MHVRTNIKQFEINCTLFDCENQNLNKALKPLVMSLQ